MASASGLMLVPKEKRNVLQSSTKGTGELIKEAIKLGAKTVVLGLGGFLLKTFIFIIENIVHKVSTKQSTHP